MAERERAPGQTLPGAPNNRHHTDARPLYNGGPEEASTPPPGVDGLWTLGYGSMLAGTWTPPTGSIMLSASIVDGRPTPFDMRLIRRFARLAISGEGSWWVVALNAPAVALTEDERAWVLASWWRFLDGERVFRRVRRP